MDEREQIEERLRAYIHPNEPASPQEEAAFADAVDAQLAWEQSGEQLPPGVDSLAIGSYSIKRGTTGGAPYTSASLCPAAWAILFNAGLLKRTLPQAQRV